MDIGCRGQGAGYRNGSRLPGGSATLGADDSAIRFGWDNERPAYAERVDAFSMQRHDVTNAEYSGVRRCRRLSRRAVVEGEDWAWVR
jgi:formylglycine-generating enzyme required for sulfatase activity